MSLPYVVKLGGSVITRKRGVARLRPKVLARLARELLSADHPVVIVHGAGSFGHPAAKQFGLARPPNPADSPTARARGAAIVSAEVRRLHAAVVSALLHEGGRPWSTPAALFARQDQGTLTQFSEASIREALASGLQPITFGDVVHDSSWGFSILSGDTLAIELARLLPARRVLFVSDVEGIYRPGGSGRRDIIETLTSGLVQELGEGTAGPDVTGGIRTKARAMLAIAEGGCDAGLISGLTDGTLSRALRGEPVNGSWAKAASR